MYYLLVFFQYDYWIAFSTYIFYAYLLEIMLANLFTYVFYTYPPDNRHHIQLNMYHLYDGTGVPHDNVRMFHCSLHHKTLCCILKCIT